MKLLLKLCFLLLVLGLAVPLWLNDPSGKPIMQLDDWLQLPDGLHSTLATGQRLLEQLPTSSITAGSASDSPEFGPSSLPTAESGKFYRWQDTSGNWHFADRPPQEGAVDVELAALPEVSNSLAATKSKPEAPVATGTAAPMNSSITPPMPEGVSKEAIEQMLQDAHERRMGENY